MHRTDASTLLRRALQGNGVFSACSGLVLIMAAKPLAVFLGLNTAVLLLGIGGLLLVYAVSLFYNAQRATINQAEARLAVLLDMLWVAGSIVILLTGWLTAAGNWTVAIVADMVLIFAVVQFIGLRRMQHEQRSQSLLNAV